MKVTFVLPGMPWRPVGGFRVVYEYANRLVARGHSVTVVHARRLPNWDPAGRGKFHVWLRKNAGRLRDLILRPRINWQAIDGRVQLLFAPLPFARYVPDGDAVFATSWATAEYVAPYPASKGMKCYLVMDFPPHLGPKERIEATWRLPMKKVAISQWLYEQVLASGAVDVIAAPCGIDFDRFKCQSEISARPMKVAMMYSPAPYKSPQDGIKAMEIARSRFPSAEFICFGPQKRPKSLPDWIRYESNIPETRLVELYNNCSIFLSSSLAEGFALPSAEAMACGCAVVATDCGGNRDYAENDVTALVSAPGDPEALAGNLAQALQNKELRIRLSEAGQTRIRDFTWERSTNRLEDYLQGRSERIRSHVPRTLKGPLQP